MQIAVLLRRNHDVSEWKRLFSEGIVPDESPYGFHFAASDDCHIKFSRPASNTFLAKMVWSIFGFDLLHAMNNWDIINSADIVWTTTEVDYLAVLFNSWIRGQTPPKLLAQNIWLFDRWKSLSALRKAFYSRMIQKASIMTVHSKKYIEVIREIIPGAEVRLMLFGVSRATFPLTPFREEERSGPLKIVAAGNDRSRDWKTLREAFGNDNRFDLTLATKSVNPAWLRAYSNLRYPSYTSFDELAASYRCADFVVIPMFENLYSGITVALEATALGAPVISSNTGGVPSYFDPMEVIYVPPGDPAALRDAALNADVAARRAMVQRAQRRFTREDYTSEGMALRYLALSRELLGEREAP